MKNIVAITLTILVLLLIGFVLKNFMPQSKDLSVYLPVTVVTPSSNFIQTNIEPRMQPYMITLGPSDEESTDFEVTSMQGQYVDGDGRLALTVIAQEVDKDMYNLYQEKAWARFQAPSRGGVSEQSYINGHDVYVSFRDIQEGEDTSNMLTLGSGYVFVPKDNTVITFSLYNPRLYACEDVFNPSTCLFEEEKMLPTIDDAKKVAEEIISFINK